MVALIVIASILLFLIFILSIRVKVCIVGNNTFSANLKILFIRVPLYPRPQKSKKVIKAPKKKKKKEPKQAVTTGTPSPTKKKSPTQIIRLILHMLKKLYKRFPGYFKITLKRFVITVGGPDAAKTAIRYGVIRASAAYLFTAIESMSFRIKTPKKAKLEINPDFLSNETSCDINMNVSISVFAALRLGIRTLSAFLSGKETTAAKKRTEETSATAIPETN